MISSGCSGAGAYGILCACRLFKYQCTTKLKSACKGTSNLNETRLRKVKCVRTFVGGGRWGGYLTSSLRYPFDSNIEGWLKDPHPYNTRGIPEQKTRSASYLKQVPTKRSNFKIRTSKRQFCSLPPGKYRTSKIANVPKLISRIFASN